jgi:TonB family protein
MGYRIIVATCLLLLATPGVGYAQTVAANQAQETRDWQRYTAEGEEFSVLLPELPAVRTEKFFDLTVRKDLQLRIIGAYANGVAYAVYAATNPGGPLSFRTFIVEAIRRYAANTFSHQRTSNLGGFRGEHFAFNSRSVPGLIRFYQTPKHLYSFWAIGAEENDPRVAMFFSSLLLEKKPEGVKVSDGEGAQLPPSVSQPESGSNSDSTVDAAKPLSVRDVTRKSVVVTKPVPRYTDSALADKIRGKVVLRVVFTSYGRVENISELARLPDGLTERAVAAARQIRFVPAMKDGRFVSTWMQLEYYFNAP